LASSYEGQRFNSPNDAVYKSNGDLYFTDPPYGLRQPDGSIAGQELPFIGVFRWSATDGLTLEAEDFERPNGLVLTDDGRRMYIADTQHAHVRVFDVTAEGSLSNSRLFVDTRLEAHGAPDG
jgi:gluconolactonase